MGTTQIVLNKFIDFFRIYQDSIDEDVRQVMVKLTGEPNTSLAELQSDIDKRKKARILDRALWHCVKNGLDAAEKDLAKSNGEVNQILSNLPASIR